MLPQSILIRAVNYPRKFKAIHSFCFLFACLNPPPTHACTHQVVLRQPVQSQVNPTSRRFPLPKALISSRVSVFSVRVLFSCLTSWSLSRSLGTSHAGEPKRASLQILSQSPKAAPKRAGPSNERHLRLRVNNMDGKARWLAVRALVLQGRRLKCRPSIR